MKNSGVCLSSMTVHLANYHLSVGGGGVEKVSEGSGWRGLCASGRRVRGEPGKCFIIWPLLVQAVVY